MTGIIACPECFGDDVNGRLIQKRVDKGGYRPQEWRYRWDARSQLTGLETPEGERWEYRYDPFGRRISKRCTNRDKPGMDFHWQGDPLSEEIPTAADGTPDHEKAIRWLYEPGSFTPIARYEKGRLHYTVTDTVGRIQELLTEDGTIVWQGKQGHEEGINKDDAPTCRLRFAGQYEDEESGLYYNRFRYYDSGTGQYISPDPIGLEGGVNPYGYASNPLKWIDPLGLACCPPKFGSRNEAFRAAKRDAGIPMGQQPDSVNKVPITDMNGRQVMDVNHNPLSSREYSYTRPDGSNIVIQEHSAGHTYGSPGNQGPHFNPRPVDPRTGNGSRNGSVDGMSDHYEFPMER